MHFFELIGNEDPFNEKDESPVVSNANNIRSIHHHRARYEFRNELI